MEYSMEGFEYEPSEGDPQEYDAPPPPAPPPQLLDAGASDGYIESLMQKVQRQARDLMAKQEQLDAAQSYGRLCEKRILELHPDHPMPVTADCLGLVPAPSLKQSKAMRSRGVPSHQLSAHAKQHREQLDAAQSYTALERQHKVAKEKLAECARQLKEVRAAGDGKDRDLASQTRRAERLQTRVAELELEGGGGDGVGGGALADGGLGSVTRASLGASGVRGGETKGSDGPSSSSAASDALRKQNAVLNRKMEEITRTKSSLAESLRAESRTNEEQRVYISVLEDALKVKAGELGFGGHPEALAELAKLRSELAGKDGEASRLKGALEAMEVECKELRRIGDDGEQMAKGTAETMDQLRESFLAGLGWLSRVIFHVYCHLVVRVCLCVNRLFGGVGRLPTPDTTTSAPPDPTADLGSRIWMLCLGARLRQDLVSVSVSSTLLRVTAFADPPPVPFPSLLPCPCPLPFSPPPLFSYHPLPPIPPPVPSSYHCLLNNASPTPTHHTKHRRAAGLGREGGGRSA
jgi:hypothetical protein